MTTSTSIHRLLDEAFAGVAPSPASQDLKEELRASLAARVEELLAAGIQPDTAARQAFEELGDVHALIADTGDDPRPAWDRERVRISPGFVIRATLLPIAAAAALALGILALTGGIPGGSTLAAGLAGAVALLLAVLVGDCLHQDTRANYAMPAGRAAGYGLGVGLVIAAAGGFALCWTGGPLWAWLGGAGILLLAGIGLLAGLGATQTNRHRAWVQAYSEQWMAEHPQRANRFERDPAAAARYGIYTMLLWVVSTVIAILLGIFVGWWWAALPWIAAFVAMMLLLTQMLFKSERH